MKYQKRQINTDAYRLNPSCNSSRVTTTVTGELVTRRLESGNECEVLKGQPGSEIVLFTTKDQLFPEVSLVSTQAVREYLALVWEQYKLANRKMRTTLLDEVCRNLKLHRKAAIRALNSSHAPRANQGKGSKTKRRRYSEASKEALVHIWKSMNYMASLRLKACGHQATLSVEVHILQAVDGPPF